MLKVVSQWDGAVCTVHHGMTWRTYSKHSWVLVCCMGKGFGTSFVATGLQSCWCWISWYALCFLGLMMVEVENLKMSWLQVEQAGCKQSEGQQTSTLCTCNCSPASGTMLIVLFLWDGAWFRDMCNVFAAGWCWLIMSWRRNCTWSRQWRGAKRVAGEVDLRPSTPPTACLATRLVDSGVSVGWRYRFHGTCIIFGAGWRWLIMGWRANLVLETTLHSSIPGPCAFLVQQVADFRFLKEWQSAATCAFLDKSLERCKPWCAFVTLYKICGPLRMAPIVHSSLIADGWLQTDPAQESCPCGSDFSLLQLRADWRFIANRRMATSRVLEFWMAKTPTLFKEHRSPNKRLRNC